MTGQQAAGYCQRLGQGWYSVAINDPAENNFVNRVITGGELWNGHSSS